MANMAMVSPAGIEGVRPVEGEEVIIMEMVTRKITFLSDPEAVGDMDTMGPSAYRIGGATVPAEAFLPGEGRCRMLSERWKAQMHPSFPVRWFRRMMHMPPLTAVMLKGPDFGGITCKVFVPRSAIRRIEKVEESLFVSE